MVMERGGEEAQRYKNPLKSDRACRYQVLVLLFLRLPTLVRLNLLCSDWMICDNWAFLQQLALAWRIFAVEIVSILNCSIQLQV